MTRPRGVGTVRPVPVVDALLHRWRRLPPLVADAALAIVVAAVTVISLVVDDANDPERHMTWWGWALQTVQFVAIVWRRRAPVVVALVVCAAAFANGAANLPDPAILFAVALAVYSVGAYEPRRVSPIFAVVLTVGGVVPFVVDRQTDAADVAVNYLVGITAWVLGYTMRSQRERAHWLAERQQAEAERAAADERVRIARDLHDIVAHHLSVVVVQTEAAQEVLAADPTRAGAAMAAVGDTARTALAELRRALGVLRSDAGRAPQVGLDGLEDLVAAVRAAGLAVEMRDSSASGDGAGNGAGGLQVAAVVGATAYRVVQEALTNVLRHAAARRAWVEVGVEDGSLVVQVSDDGRGDAPAEDLSDGGGHGLVGMRERVTALGGEFAAGPGPQSGFVVRAVLPLVAPDEQVTTIG
jgi:signal transduction histidine kinase